MQLVQPTQASLPFFAAAARDNVIVLRPAARKPAGAPLAATGPMAHHRPLRLVVRHADDGSCRLMASGRLADVCAELNRLALA
ncbi:hypothetical protein [Comamonas flocculans]|uniref:Uncharacterized protein n=1 Tax=Comamonas flocculans TaxID=2597701 RepID=A0A5B8RXW5_9BURK|nr:hypothetical protein [Comamonas flocculans]QEA14371.1 hypothetical protein FOZ74_15785 [Comamonas flocculans]